MSWKPVSRFRYKGRSIDNSLLLVEDVIPDVICSASLPERSLYQQLVGSINHNSHIGGIFDGGIVVSEYLTEKIGLSKVENIFIKLCKTIYSLQAATPSRRDGINRFSVLYYDDGSADILKDHLVETIKNKDYARVSCLVRGRGTGKSTIQNKIINEHLDEIEGNECVLVRCDAGKLYKNIYPLNVDYALEDYLNMQFIRILITNTELRRPDRIRRSALYKTITNKLKSDQGLLNINGNQIRTFEAYEKAVKVIRKRKKEARSDFTENIVTILIKSDLSITNKTNGRSRCEDYQTILELGKKAFEITCKLGCSIYYLVDGVDNVLWHHNDQRQHYKNMIDQVKGVIRNPSKNTYYLFSMRPEFIEELNNSGVAFGNIEEIDPDLDDAIKYVRLDRYPDAVDLCENILKKKTVVATDVGSIQKYFPAYFTEISEEENWEIELKNCFDAYIDVYEAYINSIKSSLDSAFGNTGVNATIDDAYNYNIRALSHNLISYVRAELIARKLQKSVDKDRIHRDAYRNLFLNGKRLIETKRGSDNSSEFGSVFLNPFWYDKSCINEKEKHGVWHGLSFIRVMQLLDYFDDLYEDEDEVVSLILQCFNYSKPVLVSQIERAITYGLIKFVTQPEFRRAKLRLTTSARFMRWLILNKPDIVMYLAFDTPLNRDITILLKEKIVYEKIEKIRYRFSETMIYVFAAFMAHLNIFYRNEMNYLNSVADAGNRFGIERGELLKIFEIKELEGISSYFNDMNDGTLKKVAQMGGARPVLGEYSNLLENARRVLNPVDLKTGLQQERDIFFHGADWAALFSKYSIAG